MKKTLLLILTLGGTYCTYAQICGTPSPANPIIYSSTSSAKRANTSICVNVYFHIVRNTNGTNAFTPPNTGKIINKRNTFYSTHNITFNNEGLDFIDNSDLLIIDTRNSVKEDNVLFSTQNRSGVINFYIVDRFVSARLVGKAQTIPSRNLVMRDTDVLTSVSSHELGHCLGLYHTFHGSPAEPTHGSCLEYIISSHPNCEDCGDMVCDTPADENDRVNRGYNPDLTNIMSYYLPADHFTNGQGYRMRYAIQNESVLRNITSNSCIKISEVNNVCYPQTTAVALTNLGSATTVWTSSNNIQVVSSNNTSITVRASSSSATGNGWVKAILSNGVVLKEGFEVGVPPSNNLVIRSLGGFNIHAQRWAQLDARYTNLSNLGWGTYTFEWIIPNSMTRISPEGSLVSVYPLSSGTIYIKTKAKNECGYSNWKGQLFIVIPNDSGGGDLVPVY